LPSPPKEPEPAHRQEAAPWAPSIASGAFRAMDQWSVARAVPDGRVVASMTRLAPDRTAVDASNFFTPALTSGRPPTSGPDPFETFRCCR
jgi:hypothetical protein